MTAWSSRDWHLFYSSEPLPGETEVRAYCTCTKWEQRREFVPGKIHGVPGGVSERTDEDVVRNELSDLHDEHLSEVRRK